MKTLSYWISADKYSLLQTKDVETTISQIAELLWSNWKISIEWKSLNFWWEENDDKVEIKISLPWMFSKKKEEYIQRIMENLVMDIEKGKIDNINLFEKDENIDIRVKNWGDIKELKNYSYTIRSSKIENYLWEICKLLNESSESKQYLTTLWLRVSDVEKNDWELKNIRKFNLPENVSKSRLYMCSLLLKKIIKQVAEEEYYISDWIVLLFNYLQSLWVTEQIKPSYNKNVLKLDALKNYFWQLQNNYLPDSPIDKYNLKSLKTVLNFLKLHKKECNEVCRLPDGYAEWVKNANLLLKGKVPDYGAISNLCDYVLNVFLSLDSKQ